MKENKKNTLDIDIHFSENKKTMCPRFTFSVFANINNIILKANKNVERSVEETLMK